MSKHRRHRQPVKVKPIRRKVIDAEYQGSDLGGEKWWLTLACGHEIYWGHWNAFSPPATVRCTQCEQAKGTNDVKLSNPK